MPSLRSALLAVAVVLLAVPAGATARGLRPIGHAPLNGRHAFTVVADGGHVAWTTANGTARIYDIASGRTRTVALPKRDEVQPCALQDAAWGQAVLTCGRPYLLDLASGALRPLPGADDDARFSELGRHWVLSDDSGEQLWEWVNIDTGRALNADPKAFGDGPSRFGDTDARGFPPVHRCSRPGRLWEATGSLQLLSVIATAAGRHDYVLLHCRGRQAVRRTALGIDFVWLDVMGPRLTAFERKGEVIVVRNRTGRRVLHRISPRGFDADAHHPLGVGVAGRRVALGVPTSTDAATIYLSKPL